jgi:hypothetical protein
MQWDLTLPPRQQSSENEQTQPAGQQLPNNRSSASLRSYISSSSLQHETQLMLRLVQCTEQQPQSNSAMAPSEEMSKMLLEEYHVLWQATERSSSDNQSLDYNEVACSVLVVEA